ncbi:PseG/SpsG family protein, partial [bacterium]
MKVVILTEGGKDKGFGHITRCLSLYQAFEQTGIRPLFIVNGDESVGEILKNTNYIIFDWLKENDKFFEMIKGKDCVIIDSYLADKSFYMKVSDLTAVPVYIDDTMRINYPKGIVLNSAINALEMSYPIYDDVIYLLGSNYCLLRKPFWSDNRKEVHEKINTILITFGGNDISNLTPKILKELIINYPEYRKKVIIGKAFTNITLIEELRDSSVDIVYYPDAYMMKKHMLDSDLVISAAGQTLYELICLAIPTIAVKVTDNQT